MSSIKLTADSGGGTFEIKAPASSANTRVLTLPDETATLLTSATSTGKILQTVTVSDSVRGTSGSVSVSSQGTYYATPFTVTITPSATSSKILLMGHVMGESSIPDYRMLWSIERAISGGATTDILAPAAGSRNRSISNFVSGFYSSENASTPTVINFSGLVDSPSTTSAITYTFQVAAPEESSVAFYYNRTNNDTDAVAFERGLSWITAQEIGA